MSPPTKSPIAIFRKRSERLPVLAFPGSGGAGCPSNSRALARVPIESRPSRAASRFITLALGEMLASRRIPQNLLDAIEAKQAELRPKPQITIRSLSDRLDRPFEKSFADRPRGVCVLIDIERGV